MRQPDFVGPTYKVDSSSLTLVGALLELLVVACLLHNLQNGHCEFRPRQWERLLADLRALVPHGLLSRGRNPATKHMPYKGIVLDQRCALRLLARRPSRDPAQLLVEATSRGIIRALAAPGPFGASRPASMPRTLLPVHISPM